MVVRMNRKKNRKCLKPLETREKGKMSEKSVH